MLDIKELWVGEGLRIVSSGKTGTFQGLSGTRARVRVGSKILLVPARNLELYEEVVEEETFEFKEDKPKPLSFHDFPRSIDLHIEKLAPEMVSEHAVTILNYQMAQLKQYIERAEIAGLKFVTIIHGKGTGVLRTEVLHFLKGRESVNQTLAVNGDGATEVYLYNT